ncbi:MAG TPA: radical SAM protein [Gaiellaceae bacterium]|nr:radical SAM protein [Gaiellaceae bacterium]
MRDTLGRPLQTLRVSITDRCNFRCVYCMPRDVFGRDHTFLARSELLTLEEITRVARAFARLGVRTVHITGGEPLVRRNVEHLVELLATIPGLELALTTNGSLLTHTAAPLAHAGLERRAGHTCAPAHVGRQLAAAQPAPTPLRRRVRALG